MITPYRTLIVGLPRSMTYWTAQTLGFDHDITAWPVATPKPGLCETALYLLPREEREKYFDAETKIVHLERSEKEVEASLARLFPTIHRPRLRKCLRASTHALRAFLRGRPHLRLAAPLTAPSLERLAVYLDRRAELPAWQERLAQRHDRMADPAIHAECFAALGKQHLLTTTTL